MTDQVAYNITHNKQALADLLLMAGNQLKEKEAVIKHLEAEKAVLSVENTIMKPKADYFDELVDRNLLTSFRETAKQLKIKERKFIDFLMEKKYIYRDKKGKLQPTANKTMVYLRSRKHSTKKHNGLAHRLSSHLKVVKPLDYYLSNYALTVWDSIRFYIVQALKTLKSYGNYSRGRL